MTASPLPALPAPRLLTAVAQATFLAVLPGGGQDHARRNAGAARRGDVVRARERPDVERAPRRTLARAEAPVGGTGAAGR